MRVLIVMAIAIILLSCSSEQGPDISFSLDNDKIEVPSGTLSQGYITATIVRHDEGQNDVVVSLRFPDGLQHAYATSVDGDRQLAISTRQLRGKDAKDTVQFKVYAESGEAIEATYVLTVELLHNATVIDTKLLEVHAIKAS